MYKNTVFLAIPNSVFPHLVSLTTFDENNINSTVEKLYLQHVAALRAVGLVIGEFIILSIHRKIEPIKSKVVAKFNDKLVKVGMNQFS